MVIIRTNLATLIKIYLYFMFNLFKKKNQKENNNISLSANIKEKEKLKEPDIESIEKSIIFHTMPEKFRVDHVKANKAKTAGIIIIISGIIFVLIISFLVYIFLIKTPEKKSISPNDSEENNNTINDLENKQNKKEEEDEQNIGKEEINKSFLPKEDLIQNIATTTGPEDYKATSTEDVNIIDSDRDGLADLEENLLGSLIDNEDSDGDGYNDLSELINLYDPTGPEALSNNINIINYINQTFDYSLLRPASWVKISVGGDDSIMFKSNDGHFIQIISQPNADQQPIEDWYAEQFQDEEINKNEKIIKESWQGIKNLDGLTIYLTDANYEYIYVISYSSGTNIDLSYKNIFNMIINSFEINK